MRLTTKGRYAVKAMLDLAIRAYEYERWRSNAEAKAVQGSSEQKQPKRAVSLADIAERQDISLTYLEQLFRKLRTHGLVNSIRGPGGGYVLADCTSNINIADIMTAVGEGIEVANSASSNPNKLAENLWADLTNQIQSFLTDISLADLIAHHEGKRLESKQDVLFDMAVNSDITPHKRKNLILVSNNS